MRTRPIRPVAIRRLIGKRRVEGTGAFGTVTYLKRRLTTYVLNLAFMSRLSYIMLLPKMTMSVVRGALFVSVMPPSSPGA